LLRPVHLLALAADLLLVQSWSTRTAIFFLAPAWTLSCEAFFYLTFPWLILHLRPRSNGSATVTVAALWILTTAAPLWYLHHVFGLKTHLWIPEHDSDLLNRIQFTPIFHLPQFLAGMVLGWIAVERPPHPRTARRLTLAGLLTLTAALACSQHLPYILLHNGLLLPAYAALILGLTQPNPLSDALSTRALILLGEASFALYLYHWFFAWYMPNHSLASVAWKVAVCIALSVAVHLLVERPARKSLLRRWNRRHPRA
jgi:peptidoglycan/LPS O-acetylase OafA/YrhL